jgi:hypothetical protein
MRYGALLIGRDKMGIIPLPPPKPRPSKIRLITESGKDVTPKDWTDYVGYEDIILLWNENPELLLDEQIGER